MQQRIGTITRNTKETQITLTINLDGSGKADISTGIGFFDHMLNSFARHGLFDLTVKATGDLEVDCHHTIEDVGIVLGQAIAQAVGDKKSICRYGDCILPMDEALILCAIDLSGRPYLGYEASIPSERVGGFDTEMAKEFFYAISYSAAMNLHIRQLAGDNSHHIIEGMFKSLGHTLRKATEIDSRFRGEIPSTKGRLSEEQELSELTGQAYQPRRSSERPVTARPMTEKAVGRSERPTSQGDGISRGLGDGSYAKGIAKGVTEALNLERAPEISGGTPNRRAPLNSAGSKNTGAVSTDATKPLSKPLQKKMSSTAELEKELQEKGLL